MITFASQFYESDGVRMRYFTAGAGAPLLFLHGGGVRAMTYRRNLESFARDFFVIAPDVPPFGASSMPPAEWDFINYADYLSGFVESRGLEKLTVSGHSFGGGIAFCLAARSSRVGRLVLVDAAGVSLPPLPLFFTRFFAVKALHNLSASIPLTLKMEADFIANVAQKLPQVVHGIRIILRAMKPQYREEFAKITVPTLILWGTEDELFPLKDAHELGATIPGSRTELIPGNHDWCLFRPELLSDYIGRFVYSEK